ncbi:Stage V sporulation protein AB (SpoVAB) [Anoxybacillus flavithermus]|nr:Stage V sporulation protein AB (SpoVAB) [Anoxybacillus flavithermus]
MMIREFVVAFVGLAGGLAVGSGFVAFLTVLGVIPRLTQLTKTMKWIATYERGVVLGAVVSSWISLRDPLLSFPPIVTSVIGLLSGVFVGMLAAALTEVLNVFPILAKRLGIDEQIVMLLMAMVFGKVAGSLFHWIYFVDR